MTDFPLLKKIGLNRKHSTRSYRLQGNNGKAAAFSQLHGASGPSLRWWWKLDPDRLDADSQMVSENFLGAPLTNRDCTACQDGEPNSPESPASRIPILLVEPTAHLPRFPGHGALIHYLTRASTAFSWKIIPWPFRVHRFHRFRMI